MRTLLVDNHDSFTDNLARLVDAAFGTRPVVLAHDDPALRSLDLDRFAAVLVGPGPGRPQSERDVRWARWVVETCPVPLLGVCLGHQLIAVVEGGVVEVAPQPRHGWVEQVRHDGRELFAAVPQGFSATRYHSLHVAEPLPPTLEATAWAADGVVMALRHRTRPVWGVQFHPESVATSHGLKLMTAFSRLAAERRPAGLPPAGSGRPGTPPAARRPARTRPRWGVHRAVLPFEADAPRLAEHLAGGGTDVFWLDSARHHPELGRHSYLGDGGGPYAESLRHRVGVGVTLTTAAAAPAQRPGTVFDVLEARLAENGPVPDAGPAPLGGYVGWFGYECKADAGAHAPHHATTPDAAWLLATRVVEVDHDAEATTVAALVGDDAAGARSAALWVDAVTSALVPVSPEGSPRAAAAVPGADIDALAAWLEPWLDRGRDRYLSDVRACLESLRAGDSYELCLTDLLRVPFAGDPFRAYLRQRAANPSPYAAFLRMAGVAVLSASPERFLRVGRDRWAESRPVKGTTPRHADPQRDAEAAQRLVGDPKAQAENLMVVDLVRHDLGLACDVVEVPTLNALETQPTVHHLVSTVRGRLRRSASAVSAARACFPPGSMTGAPKLRTMELLDALETSARGVYSGALGWFGPAGDADLAVVIRTAVVEGDALVVGAGGAVVLDSTPDGEWAEMLVKAGVPLRGVLPPAARAAGSRE